MKHLGSARTDAELGMLLEQARDLLADPTQAVLELGIAPTPRVAGLATAPVAQGVLDPPPAASTDRRDGQGRVVSTDSRLLFEALAVVVTSLGFDAVGGAVFRDLVLARIVEPTSLLDTGRVLTDLGHAPASYATMKRTLGRAKSGGYRDQIVTACFAHAASKGDISRILYDVTTLYFEAEKEVDLRKVGYSNYAAVPVMPRWSWARRCSRWSAASDGSADAA